MTPWDWRVSSIVDRLIRGEIDSTEAAILIADLKLARSEPPSAAGVKTARPAGHT